MSGIINKDGTYELFKSALNASFLRQETISNNIANVNTPNYKANRVLFEETLKKAVSNSTVGIKTTKANHIGNNQPESIQPKVIKDKNLAMRNDGNNVDIDLEMANLAANQLLYNTLIQQTNSKIGSLRYIIHEGRR